MSLSQKNNLNLLYDCNVARVYYHENEFYAMIITKTAITPFATKKVGEMAENLMKAVKNCPTPIDLRFNHAKGSLSKNKNRKLKQLLFESQNVDTTKQLLIKWLLLLL